MQSIKLEPGRPRAKFLKIGLVSVDWERKALRAAILFDITRDRQDTRSGGMVIYAHNAETLCKQLQDLSLLYPPKRGMIVYIPDEGAERQSSKLVPEDI